LKRTKFKIDLASDYRDALETDLKASGQLNQAVEFLSNDNITGLEIMPNHSKWIVTTSFEGVLTHIDDCLKVNYFDLIWALLFKQFNSLEELKIYIENDGPFNECKFLLDELN
jgi:hypothetical protein